MGRFISPFVDFGFKYIFGREESKPFLIDFLNGLLSEDKDFSPIVNLTYRDKERSKDRKGGRSVIYEIHCETEDGRFFTVEMQNAHQANFSDRLLYYFSKGVVAQGKAGTDWNYDLQPIYVVAFMNFKLKEFEQQFKIDAEIRDSISTKLLTDKARFILLQLPNFSKATDKDGCETDLEKWMYNIINMPTMETMAFTEERQLFAKLEQMASYAALNEDEQRQYDADLKAYRTITGQMKSAKDEGKAEGRAEGRAEAEQNMIREMFREGLSFEVIARIAKTTVEHIKKILQQ